MRGKTVVTKGIILLMTTCNTAGYVLLVKHTLRESEQKYYSTTVVLSTEILKLTIALLMVLRENLWSFRLTLANIYKYKNGYSLGIPALIYALQNNFLFIGLSNLDAASFQVTNQLKIITTAIFMVLLLKKKFSIAQWIALTLLFVGVVLVQMDSEFHASAQVESQNKNYWLGLCVVLLTTITSGFAGVYFEMIVKNKYITFWICNVYLYVWGIIFAVIGVLYNDLQHIENTGLFYGYTPSVITIIVMSSFGGLLSSLVIHQLSNIWKGFASSAAIIFAIYGSFLFFNTQLGPIFYIGAALVCISSILFSLL